MSSETTQQLESQASSTALGLSDDVVVSVQNVSKAYRIYGKPLDRLKQVFFWGKREYYQEFWALRDISFDVRRGQTVGIIGRNGSGKSTMLQVIAGTLTPTAGRVCVRGRVAALLELGSGFNPEFTGIENILLSGQLAGMTQEEITERIPAIERFADIGPFIHQPVKTYSTGMFARLAFAVSAHVEADLIILDEILSVGDIAFQKKCFEKMREIRERGTTILVVTHDTNTVRMTCNKALMFEDGQLYAYGNPAEVVDTYLSVMLRSGSKPARSEDAALETFSGGSDDDAFRTFSPDAMAQVPEKMRFEVGGAVPVEGDCRARVDASAVLSKEGEPVTSVYVGETYLVRSRILFAEPMDHFWYGVLIRDRFGQNIFGESASDAMLDLQGPFAPGRSVVVDLRFRCDLRQDTYFFSLGIQNESQTETHFYATDAFGLRVEVADRSVYGLVTLSYAFQGHGQRPPGDAARSSPDTLD